MTEPWPSFNFFFHFQKKETDLTNFVQRAVERRYNSRWVWNPWRRNKEWGATLSYSPLSGGTPETEWPVSNNIMARKLLNWFLLLLHVLSFYLQITIIACEIRKFWWSRWLWRTGTTAWRGLNTHCLAQPQEPPLLCWIQFCYYL